MITSETRPPESVVALLFRRVGDSLLATPAIRALRKSTLCARLTLICESQVARVFEHNPWVDEIKVVDPPATIPKLTHVLRDLHATIAVDFLSDPRSALGCWLSGFPRRVGFAHRFRCFLYTDCVPPQNVTSPIYSALHKLSVAERLGATSDGLSLDFFLTQRDQDEAEREWRSRDWNDRTPVAAFFVHSRRAYKRWPVERFAEVIRQLVKQKVCEPLLLDTGDGKAVVEAVRDRVALPNKNLVQVSDLGALAAILSKASVLVGNDGGPKHLSVAVGTPTVTLYLHESSRYWNPPDDPRHVALEGVPDNADDNGGGISVPAVVNAVSILLRQTGT